ncbi:MAG: hypothetical protein A3I24_00220 [Candidatus Harrisonbacteria bacterium RIFCSPLOWO2_02_FULL_41_13b]|uniref:tRNA (guanine-N(1)-)-methyltransferase n=1 Tax=Candidatus Harrisonbacteria bacterium RIFCSPLOWO2_02_FULL_41_13b TaxID=1798409 RepID=A0A1G1ZS11_9BACT|nr:MAG: hypothetical protein A3I24_00220 [Candidatus Harrisonbacteria bacterium RIFCSPLOWO2_02_FULL_41_13b]
MKFDILTIFPNIFQSYFNESILKRAQKNGLIKIASHNLRNFTADKHHKVDDSPYGGGPGMVIKIEPIFKAVQHLKVKSHKALPAGRQVKTRVILFSTRGKKLDSKVAKRLSKYDQLILICGRYEGVDERVAQYIADEEISIGDYVLSGGELPAMILVEAVSRYLPGVLGKYESLEDIKGSYPVYTKPEIFKPRTPPRARLARGGKNPAKGEARQRRQALRTWKVPKILLSGNHKKINEWRKIHGGL